MTDSTDIFREPTPQEIDLKKNGFKDIRSPEKVRKNNPMNVALAKIDAVERDSLYKKRQPFCTKCAINAAEERIEQAKKKYKNERFKPAGNSSIDVNFNIDYSKFGDKSRFERVEDQEIMAQSNVNNIKKMVRTGIYKQYICKECGNNISMEFTDDELAQEKMKK